MNAEELQDVIDELSEADLEGNDPGMAHFYRDRAVEQLRLALQELNRPEVTK